MNTVSSWRTRAATVLATMLAGFVLCAADSAAGPTGSVEGMITFHGEIPKSSLADDSGLRRELVQVNRETHGLQNVVVWLVSEESRRQEQSGEGLAGAVMDQRDHEFVPRLLAVRAGQPVKFTNNDPANHNVRTSSSQPTNEFNVFTGADGSYTHRFVADSRRQLVRVGCDIHPWMRGWIYVFDDSLFAVTDERGRFLIKSVPTGKYKLVLQQPDIRYSQERTITVSNAATARIAVEVRAENPKKEQR